MAFNQTILQDTGGSPITRFSDSADLSLTRFFRARYRRTAVHLLHRIPITRFFLGGPKIRVIGEPPVAWLLEMAMI